MILRCGFGLRVQFKVVLVFENLLELNFFVVKNHYSQDSAEGIEFVLLYGFKVNFLQFREEFAQRDQLDAVDEYFLGYLNAELKVILSIIIKNLKTICSQQCLSFQF